MAETDAASLDIDVKRIMHGDDLGPVVEMLARRYQDDPIARWVIDPKDRNRDIYRRCKVFFHAMLKIYLARPDGHVMVHTDSAHRCAMVWHEVREVKPCTMETVRLMPAMLRATGLRRNGLHMMRALEIQQPKNKVYAYLQFRGWDQTPEGEAAASTVLAMMLDRLDLQKNAAYTEAEEDEVAFFEKHGFAQTGELKMPTGAPKSLGMWRDYRE